MRGTGPFSGVSIWRLAAVAVGLAFLAVSAPPVAAAEQVRSIVISRQITSPAQGAAAGTDYKLDLRMTVEGERLAGDGQASLKFMSGQGPWQYIGGEAVHAEGTLIDNQVSVSIVTPRALSLVETRGGTMSYPISEVKEMSQLAGQLRNGIYEATESVPTASGVTMSMVTKMQTSTSGGAIEVKAEHEIVPGQVAYYNKISFRLPDTKELKDALAKAKDGVEAVVEVTTHARGRLVKEIGEWGHLREQRFEKVTPGQWYDLYYSWNGEPPAPAHKERIRVSVPTLELEGEAGFDVGVDFEVVSVERVMKRPPEISRPELLRVQVRDALHPDKDAAALAKELGLRPELSIEQTGYQSSTSLDDLVTGFSINSSGVAELLAAAMTGKGKALITGHKLSWNVGEGNVLSGASDDLGYPYLRFQQRGLFFFDVDITGLAYTPYGGGVMHEPESKAKDVMIAVTELDANTQFLVEVLVPCMEGLISAAKEAATADPLEGWKALWECLKSGLGSELAQQALADHVLINAVAIWISDLIDGGIAVAEAAGEALKPQTVEEMQEQVIEQAQGIAEEMSDMVIAAVSKEGIVSKSAASDRAGKLAPGPKSIDLTGLSAKGATDRARAAQQYAPQNRIQEGKRFVVVPASGGETLTLDLSGDGKPGELIVISKSQVTRAKYPAGTWASKLEIGRDGTVRALGGTPLETTSQPARKKAAAAEDLWKKVKEKAIKPAPSGAPIGGPCAYTDIPGSALITSIEKTEASSHQVTVSGGPGYEGLEVRYTFTPTAPIANAAAKAWAAKTHSLQLANSWYPGPRYIAKYGLTQGKTIPAVLKVITKGTCTPFVFDLSGIDTTDYFETAK